MPTTEERDPVLFLDTALPDVSPQYVVASDLSHFLESFLRRELARLHHAPSSDDMNWPFNERYVRTCDPEIERYHDVPLPWQRL